MIDTDVINWVIDGSHDVRMDEAREQLDALVERIATLEQQLKDAKDKILILEKFVNSTTPIDPPLAVQIQQAEKRGYELAKYYSVLKYDGDLPYIHFFTYEQAIAERDGGAK